MKKLRAWLPSLILLLASALLLVLFEDHALTNPLLRSYSLDYPVFASGDAQGNHYVIDTSLRRVSKISSESTLVYSLEGGSRTDSRFFYANQIAVSPSGYLLLLDELRDEKGFYLLRERVLLFDPQGRRLGVMYEQNYPDGHHDPTLVQRTRIIGLSMPSDTQALFYILEPDGLREMGMDLFPDSGSESVQAEVKETAYYPLDQAILYMADVQPMESAVAVSLKDGTIRLVSPADSRSSGGEHILFNGQSSSSETRIVPWELASDSRGELHFVDLEGKAIRNISGQIVLDRDLISRATGYDDLYEYDYYRLDIAVNDSLYTTNDEGLVVRRADGGIDFIYGAEVPILNRLYMFLWWCGLASGTAAVIAILWQLYHRVFKGRLPAVLIRALAVVALVAAVGTLSTVLLISNFNSRYTDVIFQRISQMIQIIPLVIDGDDLEIINSQADFAGPEYMNIRNGLIDAFNRNRDEWNQGYYFALYRIENDRLYGFMYMNGGIGMYHPFDWLMGSEEPGVYDLAWQGQIATEMITDITGDWIYGVGPVFNSQGQVVGLFETGTDLYSLNLENRRLIRELVWELVTIWIVLMLLLVEITVLSSLMAERKKAHIPMSPSDSSFSDGNLARPLVFLFFTAISFSIAYLPLMSRDLYEPIPGFSREVVIALPLSLEMGAFGLATVFTGFLTARRGWRPVFFTSLLLSTAGLLFSALSFGMLFFLAARALTGLGAGMGYIALRSFINLEGREDLRNRAYSNFYSGMIAGINAGLVLGSSLAAILGYRNVFLLGLGLIVLTLFIFIFMYRQTPYFWNSSLGKDLGHGEAIRTLLLSPRLWMYFIFMLLPTYIAASYVAFYFPLFGEAQGLSTPEIGRFMIMNGLAIVYLGPPLSRFVEKRFGNVGGAILGSLFWGGALVLAGLGGTVTAAGFVLIIMGLTEGFAVSSQNGLYFSEKTVKLAGSDRATGYFELFGKVGETIGPVIFAAVLLLGERQGLMILGAVIALLTLPYLLFYVLTRRSVKA